MSFRALDFNSPGAVEVATEVLAGPVNIQIAQDTEFPGEIRSVSLIEQLRKLAPVSVTLRVQDLIDATGKDIAHINLSAPSFDALRRQYPRETDAYLRPIFRDLGQEADVFLIDRTRAWQVLADAGQADPDLAARVRQIIRRFDADSFSERQAAMNDLEQLGEPAALALQQADRSGWTDQQQSMADSFLVKYRPLAEQDVARYRGDYEFLLDCLYNPDTHIQNMALARLRKLFGANVHIDLSADPSTRRSQIEQCREDLTAIPATQPLDPTDPAQQSPIRQ